MLYRPTGIFPDRLKISKVKSLHKKGDITSMTNYRPISLLTVFLKYLRSLRTYNRLGHHVHTDKISVSEQPCFRQGMFTENAAFKLTDCVLNSINQNACWMNIM